MIIPLSEEKDSTNKQDGSMEGTSVPDANLTSIVMQIIVRRDLMDVEKWGVGPLIAQGAHAATAVLYESRDSAETQLYLADLHNMRKVVLQTPDADTLNKLHNLLSSATPPVPHHMWLEQPENTPTCIALAPNRRSSAIKKALDKAKCGLWQG
ncbi:peptidyl-tRNA hydrolase II [Dacryopinax primogenitus]|uniref:peptidyl-tRNA hydrolase n=1 Tax=Dacryopinax primogenitus (strain DJM 731) TaxID=1858805 RepID=M5GBF3_DACPD|nr:peptidyl-tRNA hydrolase II [Dacryopinax primogenitus]EJU05710.1 peptidyl-tRNA hydrolase II [Dacryopinax primogenitus]